MSAEVCVVIGVGPGMGLALVRRFGREGFRVAMVARNAERLAEYGAMLQGEGIEAQAFAADVADETSLRRALDAARDAMGPASVLIYNPSLNLGGRPSELDPDRLVESFRLNVVGALVAVEDMLPAMRESGGGTVLLTGGGLALQPASPEYLSLGIGKSGIRYLAHALARDLQDEGIHVVTVTIRGFVKEGGAFDPDRIAEVYWEQYRLPREAWTPEVTYSG